MATSVVIVSDLSGDAAARTYRVSDGERVFDVDLTEAELAEYRSVVERYVSAGRPVASQPVGKVPQPPAMVPVVRRSREDVSAIKAWGEANGWEVPKRGRLGAALVEAYEQATFRGSTR